MRNWLKTILFLSAFSPVLITLAYVRYEDSGFDAYIVSLLAVGILGSVLPLLILKMVEKHSESLTFEAKKVESNDFMLLAFVGSYMFPIVAKASSLTLTVTAFLTLCIGAILWSVGSIPAHPILRFIRYRFYKVESSTGMVYIVISRRELRDPKDIKNVKKLSSSMLMEVV